ncbi:MAG: oligosaccharide flippase family protein [Candidatus Thorarchaeota archaeon]
MSQEPIRGTTLLVSQSSMSGILRLVNVMILSRLLLQSQMGQIALLAVIYGYMQFLGTAGLNHAAPYFVSRFSEQKALGEIRGFLSKSIGVVISISFGLAAILFLISPLLADSGFLGFDLILLIATIGPFAALASFLDSFLLGRYEIKPLVFSRLVFDFLRVILSIGLVLSGIGVIGVLYAWIIGEVAAVILFYAFSSRNLPKTKTAVKFSPILAFALPSLVFQTIDVTIQNTDRIILLSVTNLTSLGVYDVLLSVLFMLSFFSLAVSTAIYPFLTRLFMRNEMNQDENAPSEYSVKLLTRYLLIFLMPVGITLALNSHLALSVLFGPGYADFADASFSFSILSVSYILWGVTYSFHTSLRSLGEKRFFWIVGIGIILSEIILCWYLTLWLGLLGCALVRAGYIIVLFLTAWKRLIVRGISPFQGMRSTFLRIIPSSILIGMLPIVLNPPNLLVLGGILLLGILLYFILLLVSREFKPKDFELAAHVLPRKLHGYLNQIEHIIWKND